MHILLVEPDYYTKYPSLGLLKLASYHKLTGDTVELVRGRASPAHRPDRIYVTSLFTYAWKPVHETVKHFKNLYPEVELVLGGIYASLMPDHASTSGADHVHIGLFPEAEELLPDYSLVPNWGGSIIFASRGCVNECGFCAVPRLEGKLNAVKYSIKPLIYPGHTKVILWDNNILGAPNWRHILDELRELGLKVDFNHGLDARLVTFEVAEKLSALKMNVIRLAYDYYGIGPSVKRAIQHLADAGVRRRKIIVYTLFNYTDSPDDFFYRVRDLLDWAVVSYPMRFEPLDSLEKNKYVAPKWTKELLEMVADARRVLGFSGAFPPYEGLRQKFLKASNFEDAFQLRPKQSAKRLVAGQTEIEQTSDQMPMMVPAI